MMLVKTRVAPSPIHGLGLFTAEPIPQGTPIWRFEPGFDRTFSPAQFSALPPIVQAHLRWYSYVAKENGHFVLSGDHTGFMNHSPTPNTGASPNLTDTVITTALRNIAAGEELTCNYYDFDADVVKKLGPSLT